MKYKFFITFLFLTLAMPAGAESIFDQMNAALVEEDELAQDTTESSLPTFLVNPPNVDISDELSKDEISAEDLGIDDPSVLPGESGYWWEKFKENTSLFFTFNSETKAEKYIALANKRLLEAKKLAQNSNDPQAAAKVQEALERYEEHMAEVRERISKLKDSEELLKKFDENFLKHQQLMRDLIDELPSSSENISSIRRQAAQKWLEANKVKLEERLQTALENSGNGSKFVQLQNIATIDELKEFLSEDTEEKLNNIRQRAIEKFEGDIDDSEPADRDRIDKYLENIEIHQINKQRLLEQLEKSNIPDDIKARLNAIQIRNLERIEQHWDEMSEEIKQRFLEKLEDAEGNITDVEILEKIKTNTPQENRVRIQSLSERQQTAAKEKIMHETDVSHLNRIEDRVEEIPVLKRQVQARRYELYYENYICSPVEGAATLYRRHLNCADGSPYLDSKYQGELEIIDLDDFEGTGSPYCNYTCGNRYYEQCILDGSFDTYYIEECEYDNGNVIEVIEPERTEFYRPDAEINKPPTKIERPPEQVESFDRQEATPLNTQEPNPRNPNVPVERLNDF